MTTKKSENEKAVKYSFSLDYQELKRDIRTRPGHPKHWFHLNSLRLQKMDFIEKIMGYDENYAKGEYLEFLKRVNNWLAPNTRQVGDYVIICRGVWSCIADLSLIAKVLKFTMNNHLDHLYHLNSLSEIFNSFRYFDGVDIGVITKIELPFNRSTFDTASCEVLIGATYRHTVTVPLMTTYPLISQTGFQNAINEGILNKAISLCEIQEVSPMVHGNEETGIKLNADLYVRPDFKKYIRIMPDEVEFGCDVSNCIADPTWIDETKGGSE